MGRIWLIAPQGSRVVEQVARRLAEHFGPLQVLTRSTNGKWEVGDAVVVFLENVAAPDSACAAWSGLVDPRIEQALAADAPLIPVLVDGLTMPAAERLPAALTPLAFKHALPLRSDERLPRDVGRLVEDLEAQLRRQVGAAFPYDFWLMPFGVVVAVVGLCYCVVLVRDVTDWSFAYETVEQLGRGMLALALAGPMALGAGMLMIAGGLWWRKRRRTARDRAEYFRRGSGALPPVVNDRAWATFCAGAAAVGWGVLAAAVALAFAAAATTPCKRSPSGRRLVILGLIAAAIGAAWTTAVWLRQRELRAALVDYAAGEKELTAERFDAAIERLKLVAARWPWYSNAHYRLAEALDRKERERDAMAAVDAAIRAYPVNAQGVWGPSHLLASDAYLLRAKLHRRANELDLAERDSDAAARVGGGFINLFGGLMRFWEDSTRDLQQ
jgi:hypothetical protein